jgi:xanthine dehydrogenase accessory factor
VTVSNPCLSGGALEIFLDPRTPPPRVVVIGDTPIAHALRTLGEPLGFAIELTTDGESLPDGTDMALVVASHGRDEEAALEAALHAGVPYVGLVASRARGAAVLATLDVTDELRKQVSTPAGLDIGARTAPEIALSILAEIIAVRATERPTPEVTASAVDPVCGMTVPVVPSTLSLEHEGRTVHFCSEHCRDAFAG